MDRKIIVFLLVSAAIFTDMMVYSLVIPVLPSYSMSLGADQLMIGVIFGAFSLALLAFSIPIGLLSDRTGRRPIMVIGMLTLAASSVVFALSGNVYVLVLARLIQGMSGAATWSAGLALLADTYGPEERGEKLGYAMSIMSVGMLLGPVAGGFIYEYLGYAPTFLIPSVVACGIGLLFLVSRIPSAGIVKTGGPSYLQPILKAPGVFGVCAIITIAGAATFGLIEPFMPVYLYQTFEASPAAIGLGFGFMSLLSAVFQPVAGRMYDRNGGRVIITAGLIASGAVIALSMLMPTLLLTAAVFALLGITVSFVLSPMMPLLSDLFGGRDVGGSQGFVYGIYNTLFSLGLVVGPFAGGLLITNLSLPVTLYGHAALLALVGLLAYAFISSRKKAAAVRGTGT
ncbi:MAG: bicyclomycin/multidrug efflux system [Methanocella sp. PtaU1.Bin125]|nr:MAG: bicyclomycin/multidrug efflux system [Methanocella sp. PtaU1.Bin125]